MPGMSVGPTKRSSAPRRLSTIVGERTSQLPPDRSSRQKQRRLPESARPAGLAAPWAHGHLQLRTAGARGRLVRGGRGLRRRRQQEVEAAAAAKLADATDPAELAAHDKPEASKKTKKQLRQKERRLLQRIPNLIRRYKELRISLK